LTNEGDDRNVYTKLDIYISIIPEMLSPSQDVPHEG